VRGVGVARAAISVVNALPLGIGAAAAIDWPARTTAYLDTTRLPPAGPTVEPRRSSTPIVRAAATRALEQFGAPPGRLRLVVRSTIPPGRGLKSSSAVASSVVLAAAEAAGHRPGPEAVARLSAETGRATGVSATGAFDDALAGVCGGAVVTDNSFDRPLRRFELGAGLAVALWVPGRPHPPSPKMLQRFQRDPVGARRAVDAALDGDWAAAMEANSRLVEQAMGYRYDHLHAAVKEAGATASGVSGLGPTFAAVAPTARIPRVLRALPGSRGTRRSVRLYRAQGPERGGPP
jgi:shikimate kinase